MPDVPTISSGAVDPQPGEGPVVGRKAWRVTRGSMLYWLAAIVALHLLDTGLDPVRRPISSYLNTSARPLATTWFLALSLMVASSIVWLRAGTRPGVLRALASAIFGLVAVAIILAGMTPTGLSPVHRRLHMVGGLLTFPPLLAGVSLWTVGLLRNGVGTASRFLLVLFAAGLIVVLPVGVTYGESNDLAGLFQRTLFVCLVAWLLVAAHVVLGGGRVGDASTSFNSG